MHVHLVRTLTTFSCTNKKIDIIALTETRITKNVSILNNINI